MQKNKHEIRDPIHVFIQLDSHERKLLDSRPFQRLRHIHQLATCYLVYPGATHKRFEHSIGVMELAGRVYDIVTHADNLTDPIRRVLPELTNDDERKYWKRVIRMAALCHDIGHLPFSHAAEHELLPKDWDHERLSREIILSQEMKAIWDKMTPPLRAEDVAKLAIGPKKGKGFTFSVWQAILSEIIVGDAFGVDRMDYLLRDSHHTGVAYGKFDHYRLIETLRILPSSEDSQEPTLGIQEGGLHPAEGLLLARYFMYSTVYFHPVRRIYDIHLKDFLLEWLPGGRFDTDIEKHLQMTDNEVTAALLDAARNNSKDGHVHAHRLINRDHFKVLYQRHPGDIKKNPNAAKVIYEEALSKFGQDNIRFDTYTQKGSALDFPVLLRDGRIVSSLEISRALDRLPPVAFDYIFVSRACHESAYSWLESNRESILQTTQETE